MTERRGTKALELWCRRITEGYPGVNVQNMTTSWRDGLAFCAMIHHFRPDLIDFDSLNKDDVYGNNELAFRTAAEHLGIPALLDAEDMASCSVPDRLSILTYLSQFYQSFGGSSPSRLALSRTKESSNEGITPVIAESTTPKIGPRVGIRREACAVCKMPVFLAEKLVISRTPYHRTCFRCARCKNQLTPGNYYETEEGQYCCETCPDEEEEKFKSASTILKEIYNEESSDALDSKENVKPEVLRRSLSDEEKSIKNLEETKIFESEPSRTSRMRLNFMEKQLLTKSSEDTESRWPPKSESKQPEVDDNFESKINESPLSPENDLNNRQETQGKLMPSLISEKHVDSDENMPESLNNDDSTTEMERDLEVNDFRNNFIKVDTCRSIIDNDDYSVDNLEDNARFHECFDTADKTATISINDNHNDNLEVKNEKSMKEDTKDNIDPDVSFGRKNLEDSSLNNDESLSIVQRRLKLFEKPKTVEISKNKNFKLPAPCDYSKEMKNVLPVEFKKTKEEERSEKPEVVSSAENAKVEEESITGEETSLPIESSEVKCEMSPPIVPRRSNLKFHGNDKIDDGKKSEVTVLNASGIDLSADENYPKDLNPFESDEDDEAEVMRESHDNTGSSRISTNPFGSSEDEEEETSNHLPPTRPATRNIPKLPEIPKEDAEDENDEAPTKRKLKAPQINFNPFWSDDDEDRQSDEEKHRQTQSLIVSTPVPKPRTIRQSTDSSLSPWRNDLKRGDIYASNSSLGSTGSTTASGGTYRKKKPAPPPPIVKETHSQAVDSLPTTGNTYTGSNNSLRATPKLRKTKPAPPPPMPTSTPCSSNVSTNFTLPESPIINYDILNDSQIYETWKEPKNGKDEANRNTQSMTIPSCDETNPYDPYTDKSIQGKWKRKKGPAPARPIPHRRKIKVVSLKDVKLELDEIEMQQQGLEKQGVRLEQLIRDKAETGSTSADTSLGMDVEELVLELFALVNEKNELFRRQAELMLLRRQQRLEEEHADIEYQIRCLLCQPEATKTDFDKQREETLIQRLVEIVERRNEIVECLEMDRRREVEEDRSINTQMGIYAAKNKGDFAKELETDEETNRSRKTKKTKLKEKAKEKILRKVHKKDADKDVDETEAKLKRQNKKKWF